MNLGKNPRNENVRTVNALRSGKILADPYPQTLEEKENVDNPKQNQIGVEEDFIDSTKEISKERTTIPFPKKILQDVQISLPLLTAIEHIPEYARVLKEMCTPKRAPRVEKLSMHASILENVIVTVKGCKFPADFVVLEMDFNGQFYDTPIILGRPFLHTAKMNIDFPTGIAKISCGDQSVEIKIFEVSNDLKKSQVYDCHTIDLLDDFDDPDVIDDCVLERIRGNREYKFRRKERGRSSEFRVETSSL
ncbi:unnamed protein product [Spirodela intermedia]|uniref:Uncharacterized protein n=1 Tax=Spirodela intermedia TaxID=51605 RepID=A0A7I8J2I8_SPIIN|nr:unnamed protein product [Spirodela intermedia]CAA6664436.1 unnamed protein product [Spirodela intermedia]